MGFWVGRKTGIYTVWNDCSEQIKGYAGAKYKKLAASNVKDAEKEFSLGYKPNTAAEKKKKTADKAIKQNHTSDLHNASGTVYFCDGACQTNPGPSGAGVSLYQNGKLSNLYYGSYTEDGSNNIGELEAMIYCLESVKKNAPFHAIIYADSAYAINSITNWANSWSKNGWVLQNKKPVKNKELIEKGFLLYQDLIGTVEIRKVKAHINEEGNELADRMAILASNKKQLNWVELNEFDISSVLGIEHKK